MFLIDRSPVPFVIMARTRETPPKRANDSRQGCVTSATTCSDHSLGASEIMKSPWWISVGLAALFAFATSTVLADKECDKKKKDTEESELFVDCGKCDKDKGDDEEEESEEGELLADGKCDKECDKHKDGEEGEESELLADGKCDKECDKHKDGEDSEEGELLADGKCDKECDKHKDGEDSEEAELLVA
jgi:hypothetical protein